MDILEAVQNRTNTSRRLFTITQWPQHHPWPSAGGLRHLIFHAKSNGFEIVIRRSGKRILIDENAFFDWVDGQGRKDDIVPTKTRKK